MSSFANGINNAGQIVGSYGDDQQVQRAAMWSGTTAIDLNTLLRPETVGAGWVLATANAINDEGWIVGEAYNANDGLKQAYLLSISDQPDQFLHPPAPTALPEPSTYALLTFGFGIIGL